MTARSFFDEAAKARVVATVERIEKQTSAEVVVAVRRSAGSYLDADLLFGAIVGIAILSLLLFVEKEFATAWIPADVTIAFVLAALFCRHTPTLRRLFLSRRRRAENARRAGCVAFHEQKIGGTTGRNGILVLVSVFERRVAVICDLGIDPAAISPGFQTAVESIERSIDHLNPNLDAFVTALEALGPALATAMPCGDSDVNELPDHVGTDA